MSDAHENWRSTVSRLFARRTLPRRRRRAAASVADPTHRAVAIGVRVAGPGDVGALERLAALDEEPMLEGDVLVAEVEGVLWAALDLASKRCVADPFVASADAVELLRVRARQVQKERRSLLTPGSGANPASATVGT